VNRSMPSTRTTEGSSDTSSGIGRLEGYHHWARLSLFGGQQAIFPLLCTRRHGRHPRTLRSRSSRCLAPARRAAFACVSTTQRHAVVHPLPWCHRESGSSGRRSGAAHAPGGARPPTAGPPPGASWGVGRNCGARSWVWSRLATEEPSNTTIRLLFADEDESTLRHGRFEPGDGRPLVSTLESPAGRDPGRVQRHRRSNAARARPG
jgi:hypothetical protein